MTALGTSRSGLRGHKENPLCPGWEGDGQGTADWCVENVVSETPPMVPGTQRRRFSIKAGVVSVLSAGRLAGDIVQ
ncbi:hypothetical protein K239x_33630 [Planctomycetes bacterium K23_9]|uniref:Uncharacterized protein n=1 Tax=Stieleria marina TaxID=1930275 RepID=A0A517NW88_9BACT|nr:hypothetical protein K239x_33630 [Planctomycetes bacterium K23_9]